MRKKLIILNVTYTLTVIFGYILFLHNQTLEYMKDGYSLIKSVCGAAVSYDIFHYMIGLILFSTLTVLTMVENVDTVIGKTKYKESNRMFKGSRGKAKVYEVDNLITKVIVKENQRNLRMYLDEKTQSNEVRIEYNTLLCYKDPETGKLNEIEVQDKEVFECVELGKAYKSKITIEYNRREEVIGTHIEILGL